MGSNAEFFHKSREFQESDYLRFKAKDFPNGDKARIWEKRQDGEGAYEVWQYYVVLYLSHDGDIVIEASIANSLWERDYLGAKKVLICNGDNIKYAMKLFNEAVSYMSSHLCADRVQMRRDLLTILV